MDKQEYEGLRSKFLKLVPSVPLPLRSEIIAVVDNRTIDWDVASEEVKRNTPRAKAILQQAKKMGLI